MRSFIEHINESKKTSLRRELDSFLRREKIFGYTEDILSIIKGEPTDNVISDIAESFKDEEKIKISEADILSMDMHSMLERFLDWNGIKGYSEAILDLSGKKRAEIYGERDLLVWRKKYYYYRPKEGDSVIWAWDNPETTGVPKLFPVSKIYNTPTYYSKEYYKTKEKIYRED